MMNFVEGEIFSIDKPYGMTSFGALARVRYLLSRRLNRKVKIGHAGTLDPLATGVLVLCTGKCTKQIETLQKHTKEYVATLRLGATTVSYDMEHPENATYPYEHISLEMIEKALASFIGEIDQVPPTYSAVKVGGERAYNIRRSGDSVELQPKRVRIDEIELVDFNKDERSLTLRVVCGKGTYIRALARDLGRTLESGAYLTALRRTRSGSFNVDNSISFDSIEQWVEEMIPTTAEKIQRSADASTSSIQK